MSSIALIDYGAGNLQSVRNALKAAGANDVQVTADPEIVAHADRIVLPGVGAFGACRNALFGIDGMLEAMDKRVFDEGAPFLGICVGMQLLADWSEEYRQVEGLGAPPKEEFGKVYTYKPRELDGLGWIGGTVSKIPASPKNKVPHMGWNDVTPTWEHPVVKGGEAYFLHSYHYAPADPDPAGDCVALTHHGSLLVAAVARHNIIGVQFHPEKSQAYGLAMLERFLKWMP